MDLRHIKLNIFNFFIIIIIIFSIRKHRIMRDIWIYDEYYIAFSLGRKKCYITNILEILQKGSGSKWLDFDANGPPIVSQWGVTRTGLKPELNANSVGIWLSWNNIILGQMTNWI
jgi:hypothetical protein